MNSLIYYSPDYTVTFKNNGAGFEGIVCKGGETKSYPLHGKIAMQAEKSLEQFIRDQIESGTVVPWVKKDKIIWITNHEYRVVKSIGSLIEKPETPEELLDMISCVKHAYGYWGLIHLLERLSIKSLEKLAQQDNKIQKIIYQKVEIRRAFEKSLEKLAQIKANRPTCFICFALEDEFTKWLKQVFVPHMDLAGIEPVVCFRHLSPGMELNPFQARIRSTDKVVVICTPRLKEYCEERQKSPIGSAQEIRLALERYNEPKYHESIFPVFVKGTRLESLPTPFFEPIFATVLNKDSVDAFTYCADAFELFGGIKGIDRAECLAIKLAFFSDAKDILKQEVWSPTKTDESQKWMEKHENEAEEKSEWFTDKAIRDIKHISLPPYPLDFTGRAEQLRQLHALCTVKPRVAIRGFGGVGKSALALAFAYQYGHLFEFVQFIKASTPDSLRIDLLKLADTLLIPKVGEEERLQLLRDHLNQIDKQYLVLLDGVDDREVYDMLDGWLPESRGCFLITTRMSEFPRNRSFKMFELTLFDPAESVVFLTKVTSCKDTNSALKLAEKLGHHLLALTHAASVIRAAGLTFATYLSEFEKRGVVLLDRQHLTGIQKDAPTIFTTWRISLEAIDAQMGNSFASQLLGFFAHLANAPIPLCILQSWAGSSCDLFMLLDKLKEYSLIDIPELEVYSIHPLLKKVIYATSKDHHNNLQSALKVFGQCCSTLYLPNHRFQRGVEPLLIPHCRKLLKKYNPKNQIDEVIQIDEVLWIYLLMGLTTGIHESRYEFALARLEKEVPTKDSSAQENLCFAEVNDRLKQALQYLETGYQLCLKWCGMNGYRQFLFLHGITLILREQGKWEEAAKRAKNTLDVFNHVKEEIPIDQRVVMLREFGNTLLVHGGENEALKCLNEALECHQACPDRELFLTRSALAAAFTADKNDEGAGEQLEKILNMLKSNPESLHGLKHSPVLQLALVFQGQNKLLEAEVFLQLVRHWVFNQSGDINKLEFIKTQLHLALVVGKEPSLPYLEQVLSDLISIQCRGMPYAFVRLRLAEISLENRATHVQVCEQWLVENQGSSLGRTQFMARLAALRQPCLK